MDDLGPAVTMIVVLAIVVVVIASFWAVFTKAGQPGWAVIIPFYNIFVLLKIANKPGWWLVLYLIPVVGFVISILVALAVAKNFGKTDLFGIGLVFLPFICFPILAWGDAQYAPKA